jgi:hypothetical protein
VPEPEPPVPEAEPAVPFAPLVPLLLPACADPPEVPVEPPGIELVLSPPPQSMTANEPTTTTPNKIDALTLFMTILLQSKNKAKAPFVQRVAFESPQFFD